MLLHAMKLRTMIAISHDKLRFWEQERNWKSCNKIELQQTLDRDQDENCVSNFVLKQLVIYRTEIWDHNERSSFIKHAMHVLVFFFAKSWEILACTWRIFVVSSSHNNHPNFTNTVLTDTHKRRDLKGPHPEYLLESILNKVPIRNWKIF